MARPKTVRTCPRCGFSTTKCSRMKDHLARKRMCPPFLSDATPSIDSAPRRSIEVMTANPVTNVTGDRATINNIATQNNVTINVNAAPPMLRPQNLEDTSHITPEIWRCLGQLAKESPIDGLREFINLVNFSPVKPENMNLYVPAEGPVFVYREARGRSSQWYKVDRKDAVKWLIEDRGDNLSEYLSDNPELANSAEVRQFESAINRAQVFTVMEQNAAHGSKLVKIVHGPRMPLDPEPFPFAEFPRDSEH